MTKTELHRNISFVKSGLRLLGYLFLVINLGIGVIILFSSEILGIAEEVYGS
jgi:hypothetical protein